MTWFFWVLTIVNQMADSFHIQQILLRRFFFRFYFTQTLLTKWWHQKIKFVATSLKNAFFFSSPSSVSRIFLFLFFSFLFFFVSVFFSFLVVKILITGEPVSHSLLQKLTSSEWNVWSKGFSSKMECFYPSKGFWSKMECFHRKVFKEKLFERFLIENGMFSSKSLKKLFERFLIENGMKTVRK